MSLPRESKKATQLPPCAVCSEPASNGFWGVYLCDACFRRWWADAPNLTDLELAHADKHPDDVEARGAYEFKDATRKHDRWVLLKDEVTERIAGTFAKAWITRQHAQHRGAA